MRNSKLAAILLLLSAPPAARGDPGRAHIDRSSAGGAVGGRDRDRRPPEGGQRPPPPRRGPPPRPVRGGRQHRHPLRDAPALPDGSIAALDAFEVPGDPTRRYAVVYRRSISSELRSPVDSSGVEELTRGSPRPRPSPPRRLQSPPPSSPAVDTRLASRVEHLMRVGLGEERIYVTVALVRPAGTLTGSLRRSIASGQIGDVDDLHAAAAKYRHRRASQVGKAVGSAARWIRKVVGGRVTYLCRNSYCLGASLPARLVGRLADLPGVRRVSEVEPLLPEVNWDGVDRSEVMQVKQFIDDGHDGEQEDGTFRDDIWFGVVEGRSYDDYHPAWDKAGVNWSRVGSRFLCEDGIGCNYVNSFPPPNPDDPDDWHPTQVAALIFADLTDGQDPQIDEEEGERYSGVARNALGRLFVAVDLDTAAWDEIMDTIRGPLGPYEHVVNMSQGGTIACNGDETAAVSANNLYEDGTLLIKSAGNKSFNSFSPDVCRATTPGAAIGAFTVGGLKTQGSYSHEKMRNADIWYEHSDAGSSVGGSEADIAHGRGRTIIDLTAQAYLKFVPRPPSVYSSIVQGTSFAAPQVAGAAINFVDYFQDQHFNLEYEPGILFANLLLMGDREACVDQESECASSKIESGFDRRFGAGRARFRRFDGPGLDSPAHYDTGYVPCLADGEVVQLEVTRGAPMEGGVGSFKFVAWWYDRRHEITGTVANVDLRLIEVDEQGNEQGELLVSDDPYDNKERLYYGPPDGSPANKRLVVEFIGTDTVPGDNSWVQENCLAAGEVDVYFAYLAEDNSRDDVDGPEWDGQALVGVEPESWTW